MNDNANRCQSCGMPLGSSTNGTNADGSMAMEYCKICFQLGAFTEPSLTLKGMMQKSIDHMTSSLGMPRTEAIQKAKDVIPHLKRWEGETKKKQIMLYGIVEGICVLIAVILYLILK